MTTQPGRHCDPYLTDAEAKGKWVTHGGSALRLDAEGSPAEPVHSDTFSFTLGRSYCSSQARSQGSGGSLAQNLGQQETLAPGRPLDQCCRSVETLRCGGTAVTI